MEVVLLENIKNLGNIGDVVNVKRGHGRNFLIKYGKALKASKENIEIVNKKKAQLNDMNSKKEETEEFIQTIKIANKKIKKMRPEYEQYSTLFHTRAEVEGLYQTLSEFAAMNNLVISKIEKNEEMILLDDKGKEFSSIKFSQFLNQKMIQSTRCLTFVIGGAYGFSDGVYERANAKISLSKMTFSHQMVRMIFKEQLYRAFTIIKGEKYHHE